LSLLLIFIILRTFQAKRGKKIYFSGQIFLLYCLLYSISRFFTEYLRGDNLPLLANLTVHQLISIGIFVSVSIIWWKKNEQLSS
ncbi:MAG: prolipoprotein diacylglyceryl transferase, partial [Candidatus Omnitrophica bacterium]|nr:prolipoprotein diacylglyceryl transferase [Candidatus Omnitrophota bacterium]